MAGPLRPRWVMRAFSRKEALDRPVMVCGVLFFFKAALVHFVMAVYDVVDLRRAVVEWNEEEFDQSKVMSGAMA